VDAGERGTPQAKKLGLRPGLTVDLDHPPAGWALEGSTEGLIAAADGPVDWILAFFSSAAELSARAPDLVARIFPAGALWIAWPRRAAGHVSDLTDNVVRACLLPLGVVDVKVAAIDEHWSGLRFVWRTTKRTR
jgi:hypothetical protein